MQSRKTLKPRVVGALVMMFMLVSFGCSWTGSMFGSDSTPQEEKVEEAESSATQEQPADASAAAQDSQQKTQSSGLVARPERSKPESPAGVAATEASQEREETTEAKTEENIPVNTPESSRENIATAKPDQGEKTGEGKAVNKAENIPEIPAKGIVPLESTHKPVTDTTGDIEYKTTEELHQAVQAAIDAGNFLGYTDPFDAFPVLEGVDTMSAAFIPVDHPRHKVFYHAFFQPTEPIHKRVYGYTVIDMITNEDFGHFDGNADGIFDQKTLDPKIVLDDYMNAAKKESGEKAKAPKKQKQ